MKRHYNIPIFVPHLGCPYQCIYCNQKIIAAQEKAPLPEQINSIVESHLTTIDFQHHDVEIAFFGGNFTTIDPRLQEMYLGTVQPFLHSGKVKSIRISTRPDAISVGILKHLQKWGVKTIELGVQSLADEVLKTSLRGYDRDDVFKAGHLIKDRGFRLGIQLMIGLPGDHRYLDIKTAHQATTLKPDMVRIYPTLVIAGTALEQMYRSGCYHPLDLEQAVEIVRDMFIIFQKKGIPVIRMGLHPGDELRAPGAVIAGPFHPAFGELVEQRVFRDQAEEMVKAFIEKNGVGEPIDLFVRSNEVSKLVGHKRANLDYLMDEFTCPIRFHSWNQLEYGDIGIGSARVTEPEIIYPRHSFLENQP
ncbi:elongator complex protein 3 [Syntrophomonas erecta]